MARIKRHRNTRGQRRTKEHRNLNIPQLVYKFLGEETAEGARGGSTERDSAAKCHRCHKRLSNDLVNSASMRSTGKGTGYRTRRDTGRVSKSRCIKRRATSRDPPISYLQKCVGAEGTRKARRYIKKALHFGVESGYLIPSDPTYKILRVSSDLMKSDSQKNKSDKAHSKERETSNKLEDMQEQKRRRRTRKRRSQSLPSRSPSRRRRRGRRRRRRRRRRSRSRSRGGRYSSPQNPEEAAEDEADNYEMDDPKSNIHTSDREPKSTRSKQPDSESKKAEENDSDLSVDEDESDDEEGKKRMDTTES